MLEWRACRNAPPLAHTLTSHAPYPPCRPAAEMNRLQISQHAFRDSLQEVFSSGTPAAVYEDGRVAQIPRGRAVIAEIDRALEGSWKAGGTALAFNLQILFYYYLKPRIPVPALARRPNKPPARRWVRTLAVAEVLR